jgi:phosphopantetheinyl transferase
MLVTIKQVRGAYLGIWAITEELGELEWLHNSNTLDYAESMKISHPDAKKRFFASRILVQELCNYLGLHYFGLSKDELGKPFLASYQHKLSLTHNTGYVAAIISEHYNVGIDIEKISNRSLKVEHKFCSAEEQEWVAKQEIKSTLLWCLKETAFKASEIQGLSFADEIKVRLPLGNKIDMLQVNVLGKSPFSTEVKVEVFDGCLLTYCVVDEHHLN